MLGKPKQVQMRNFQIDSSTNYKKHYFTPAPFGTSPTGETNASPSP